MQYVVWVIVLSLAPMLTQGCAGNSRFRTKLTCPHEGGPQWLQISSPHFVLYTDITREKALKLSEKLELDFAMLDQLAKHSFFGTAEALHEKIDVIITQRRDDYFAMAPQHTAGVFRSSDSGDGANIIIAHQDYNHISDPNERKLLALFGLQVIDHELTHRLVHHHLRKAPIWLNEGLADYFATVRENEGKILVGTPHANRVFFKGIAAMGENVDMVEVGSLPRVETLVGMTHEAFYEPEHRHTYYVAAWLLVHMLNGEEAYEEPFNAYLKLLARGAEHKEAWSQAFTNISFDQLDRDYRAYALRAKLGAWEVPLVVPQLPEPTVRIMRDAELHAFWLQWMLDTPSNKPLQSQHIERTQKHPDFTVDEEITLAELSASNKGADTYPLALHLVEKAPDNVRAWLLLWRLLERKGEPDRNPSEVARVTARLATFEASGQAQNEYAWFLLEAGQALQALPYAERAAALAPTSPSILDTLARAKFTLGDLEAAVDYQARALAFLPDGVTNKMLSDRYAQYLAALKAKTKR